MPSFAVSLSDLARCLLTAGRHWVVLAGFCFMPTSYICAWHLQSSQYAAGQSHCMHYGGMAKTLLFWKNVPCILTKPRAALQSLPINGISTGCSHRQAPSAACHHAQRPASTHTSAHSLSQSWFDSVLTPFLPGVECCNLKSKLISHRNEMGWVPWFRASAVPCPTPTSCCTTRAARPGG